MESKCCLKIVVARIFWNAYIPLKVPTIGLFSQFSGVFFCKIYNLKVIKPGGALFEFLSPHFSRSAAVTIDNNFVGPARGFLNILLTRQSQRKP
jgi:hypothetical protein